MRIRKRYIGLFAALVIAAGIWHASLHRPTGPAQGVEIQGTRFIAPSAGNADDKTPHPIAATDVSKARRTGRAEGTQRVPGPIFADHASGAVPAKIGTVPTEAKARMMLRLIYLLPLGS